MPNLVQFVLLGYVVKLAQAQACRLGGNTATQVAPNPIVPENNMVALILPVHTPNVTSGLTCGSISSENIVKVEAFFWALRTYKDRWPANGPSNQNGIVFDSCRSADTVSALLAPVEAQQCSLNVLAYLVADRREVAVRITQLSTSKPATVLNSALNDPGRLPSDSENLYHLSPTAQQESTTILRLLHAVGWRYVQVLYSQGSYGQSAKNAFVSNSMAYDVTVGHSEIVLDTAPTPKLNTHDFVVVIFAHQEQKLKIFKDLGENQFIFVTTNFGDRSPAGDGKQYNSRIVDVRTSLNTMYTTAVQTFKTDVVSELTSAGSENTDNPWYPEFWESLFKCDISGGDNVCNKTQKIGETLSVNPQSVALIIQGVDLMLKALRASCNGSCPVDTLENRRKSFKSRFQTIAGEADPAFDENTRARRSWEYKVYWIERDGNRFLEAAVGDIQPQLVTVNRQVMDADMFRVMYSGGGQVVARPVLAETFYPTRYDAWGYGWVIAIGVLACIGLLLVFIISILLCVLRSRRAMSNFVWLYAVLLFGAFVGYLTLFAYLPVPTKATCGIIRFGVGISYGICFSVMVVLGLLLCKKSEMFSSMRVSNIFIAVTLILLITVEVVILVTWLIWTPPGISYAFFDGYYFPRRICNHYTLGIGNTFLRTVFENHLIHLIYIMFLILLVLLMAIFIFIRRKNLRASRNKNESYALLAAGIGTGLGTVAIWLVWTLVGAYAGVPYNDVNNYGDAAIAFGLWFTLTWLLIFLLVQIINTWRGSGSKVKKTHEEIKVNLANMNHNHAKGHGYNSEVSAVDGRVVYEHREHREHHENHGHLNKPPLIVQSNGGNAMTSYEQHVETRTEKSHYRPPPVPENEAVVNHEHVFRTGSHFCAECGFPHNPHALYIRHPRSEHGMSSHDNSFEQSTVHRVKGVETSMYEPRMATSLQALHLVHPRSRPVSRAGSLDGARRHVVHGGNPRVARSEIGYSSYSTHGNHYGPNIIDLRRPRHHDRHYDRHYYPAHHNANVYFTEKGTSVI